MILLIYTNISFIILNYIRNCWTVYYYIYNGFQDSIELFISIIVMA